MPGSPGAKKSGLSAHQMLGNCGAPGSLRNKSKLGAHQIPCPGQPRIKKELRGHQMALKSRLGRDCGSELPDGWRARNYRFLRWTKAGAATIGQDVSVVKVGFVRRVLTLWLDLVVISASSLHFTPPRWRVDSYRHVSSSNLSWSDRGRHVPALNVTRDVGFDVASSNGTRSQLTRQRRGVTLTQRRRHATKRNQRRTLVCQHAARASRRPAVSLGGCVL